MLLAEENEMMDRDTFSRAKSPTEGYVGEGWDDEMEDLDLLLGT